jgi:mycothiol synthase
MQHDHIIRNYVTQDRSRLIHLGKSFNKYGASLISGSFEMLDQMLKRPGYDIEEDLFIAGIDHNIIGYINVIPETGIGRVILEYFFHPAYCVGQIPGDLIDAALKRAKKIKAEAAQVNIPSAEVTTVKIVVDRGFVPVRTFMEMRLDATEYVFSEDKHSRYTFHRFRPGDEDKLIDIQDRSFRDTWGYDPDIARHVSWWMGYRRNNYDDIFLMYDGDDAIGYCWTGIGSHADRFTGKSTGCIYMLGVVPERRRSGIGKLLLEEGIRHLQERNRDVIELSVDGENTGAVRLYRANGFRIADITIWYEKSIS